MNIRNTAFAAALLSAAAIAAPATAQVAGIATADTAVAIARSKALGTAYQQIGTQYASFAQQMQQKRKEINDINVQLDTNKDKELTELDAAIKAKNPLLTQIDTKQKEINQLQDPIIKAQLYTVEQIALKYDAAQQAVITAKKINVILAPDAFVWAPDAVDVTTAITAELDRTVPSVTITPPADWRSSRQVAALYQQIQQLFNNAAQAQAAQAAATQPQTGQPAAAAKAPAAQPDSR
jgi:Skp family chaperone for outer membrane proteins